MNRPSNFFKTLVCKFSDEEDQGERFAKDGNLGKPHEKFEVNLLSVAANSFQPLPKCDMATGA